MSDEQLVKEMCHWSQFNLPIEVLRGLKEQGFDEPKPIQKQVCMLINFKIYFKINKIFKILF